MKTRCIKRVLLGIIGIAIVTAIIMLLWNWLIPGIFGLTTITFWQALGLFILSRILFGGFGRFGRGRMMMHNRMRENPIHEKWKKMSCEQRKEFIDKRMKFGFGGFFDKEHFDIDEYGDSGKEKE